MEPETIIGQLGLGMCTLLVAIAAIGCALIACVIFFDWSEFFKSKRSITDNVRPTSSDRASNGASSQKATGPPINSTQAS